MHNVDSFLISVAVVMWTSFLLITSKLSCIITVAASRCGMNYAHSSVVLLHSEAIHTHICIIYQVQIICRAMLMESVLLRQCLHRIIMYAHRHYCVSSHVT